MTWPTNQPSMAGLAFTASTLSGLAAITASTAVSMAPVSVTCVESRASRRYVGGVAAPRSQTISNTSLAILPEMAFEAMRSNDGAELLGRDGARWPISRPFLVESTEQLVDHPVRCCTLRVSRDRPGHRLEEVGSLALGHQHAGVVGGEPVVAHEARALRVGQLRQALLQAVDERLFQLQRQQVGIGEIAVVVRLLLGAHRARHALGRVEQPRLLLDLAAVLEDVDLAARLGLDGLADEADRVDVLDLAAGAELCRRACARRR